MDCNDATVRIRAQWAGETDLAPAHAANLRDLYAELQDTATAAAIVLGTAEAVLKGMALLRFHRLDARVFEIIERIRVTLG
jgi:hypothetical protein